MCKKQLEYAITGKSECSIALRSQMSGNELMSIHARKGERLEAFVWLFIIRKLLHAIHHGDTNTNSAWFCSQLPPNKFRVDACTLNDIEKNKKSTHICSTSYSNAIRLLMRIAVEVNTPSSGWANKRLERATLRHHDYTSWIKPEANTPYIKIFCSSGRSIYAAHIVSINLVLVVTMFDNVWTSIRTTGCAW